MTSPLSGFLNALGWVAAASSAYYAMRMSAKAESARASEERTKALHAFTQELSIAESPRAALDAAVRHVGRIFDSSARVLAPCAGQSQLRTEASSGEGEPLPAKELGVAHWVLEHGQAAGLGSDTLPEDPALHWPLRGSVGPIGVLRLEPKSAGQPFSEEQKRLLDSFARQIALSLEVARLQDSARQAQLESEKDRLRSALLSSVSHDLRTPLAGIIGSASSLLEPGAPLTSEAARELLENIQTEGERMFRLVQNLIETTRLESGAVRLKKEPCALEEVLGSALERNEKLLAGREVRAGVPEDFPLVPLDGVLMEQVLINLLENACRHTPAGTPIDVAVERGDGVATIAISDRGPGLAAEDVERVFEKFYHTKSPGAGAGLGLAICRAIVNAHGGRIWAENRAGGGSVFRFILPLEEARAALG